MANSAIRKASPRRSCLAAIGLGMTLLSPLTVFIAIAGLKTGLFRIETAYDLLTMQVGFYLAGLGLVGVILALIGAAKAFRRTWLIAVAAVLISTVSVTLLFQEMNDALGYALSNKADPTFNSRAGVSTNPADQLGFSPSIMAERQADGADMPASGVGANGCAIAHLPTQVAPGVAGYALREAGFDIRDLGVNRGSGVHTSPWFDRTYDAVIRIRPGRTDVRVAPRDGAHDYGTSCSLATKIISDLQPSR